MFLGIRWYELNNVQCPPPPQIVRQYVFSLTIFVRALGMLEYEQIGIIFRRYGYALDLEIRCICNLLSIFM